jgi:hypothetical protein
MAYTILNTDGTTLTLLADGSVDKSTTSITLVGKNTNGYGQYINNNLIKLMANFASTTGSPPTNPLKGQLWYDTTVKNLKVYDTTWKTVSGAYVADVRPTNLGTGDLWWDTTNNQLKVFVNGSAYTVGPSIPKGIGTTGFIIPSTPVKDVSGSSQSVSLIKSYGQPAAFISASRFQVESTDASLYMNTSTVYALKGLNVLGDLRASGQVDSKYYSMSVDIDTLMAPLTAPKNTYNNITNSTHVLEQNIEICKLLQFMFPTSTTKYLAEPGVPTHAEARVLCKYSNPSSGYHVRRFYVETATIPYWNNYTTTGSGVVTNQVF